MSRKVGDRNHDFEAKRSLILDALEKRLLLQDAARVSMSELAEVAGVTVSSLRHYLGSRSEVLAAVLVRHGKMGMPYLEMLREEPVCNLEVSLQITLHGIVMALQHGLGDILASGLAMGLRDDLVGPSFLNALLEPVLQSLEQRLEWHYKKGEMIACDFRVAALSLVAPVVLAGLHQGELGGDRVRPLDLGGMVDALVLAFLRSYRAV